MLLMATSKVVQGPVPGTLLEAYWSWSVVALAEFIIGCLIITKRYCKLGCWLIVGFVVCIAATTLDSRPCGCGGAWFSVTTKTKVVTACFLGSSALWLLSIGRNLETESRVHRGSVT